jgi:hypothetical protein
MVHGENAPEVLQRIADELEWLETEGATDSGGVGLCEGNGAGASRLWRMS